MSIYKSSLHPEQRFNFVCDIFHSQNIYIELILNQKYVFGMNYQSEKRKQLAFRKKGKAEGLRGTR